MITFLLLIMRAYTNNPIVFSQILLLFAGATDQTAGCKVASFPPLKSLARNLECR
jgi:hypothetical protein